MSLSALNLGPVAVGLLGYAGEVRLETAELETGYEVNVPLSGRLLTRTGLDWMDKYPANRSFAA